MSGFTPGPWLLAERELDATTIRDGQGQLVAETWMTRHGQHVANARLIAAAPDLLEALRLCMTFIVELAESGDAGFWDAEKTLEVIAARTAIARATGEQG